jgi:hypothetical protein
VTTPPPPPARTWPARLLAAAAAGTLVLTLAHPAGTRQFTWPWHPLLWLLLLAPVIALLADRTPWRHPGRILTAGLLLLGAGTLAAAALSSTAGSPRVMRRLNASGWSPGSPVPPPSSRS